MAIHIPEATGQTFLVAVRDSAGLARVIRDQSGDLTYRQINDLQAAIHRLRVAYTAFATDATALPSLAGTYITERGGPALGTVQTAAAAVATAVAAWETAIYTAATGLTGSALVQVRTVYVNGEDLKTISMADFIPAATAGGLRASAQLANLITALESLGG